MYLARTLRENRTLVEAAIDLHQSGRLPPACFLIDVDRVHTNSRLVASAGAKHDIDLLFMSKQIGHNLEAIDAIRTAGIDRTVAVDGRSASILARAGVPLGNIGHLSQVPRHQLPHLISLEPGVVTLFNSRQAEAVAAAAQGLGMTQAVQLKVAVEEGPVFPGQEGGFTLTEFDGELKQIADLDGIDVIGVTAYPCVDYDETQQTYVPSVLVPELVAAAERLADTLDVTPVVNAPGSTSVAAMRILGEIGATVAEPGHALTGTGPHHANGEGPEEPAIVYVSEIVHVDDGAAHAIGGGLYRRGRLANAIVGHDESAVAEPPLPVSVPGPGYIDYHFSINTMGSRINVGDTVVCAFRPQVFVTYCRTASIAGIGSSEPDLGPIRDSLGNPDLTWTGE